MSNAVTLFGIRHHGPGCARSLLRALQALQPDCLLIEGPAGSESLCVHLAEAELCPPVALLSHSVDDPQLALFHPYAVFSPEWQAMRWASEAGVPIRFIDVPAALSLSWLRQSRAEAAAADAADADAVTNSSENCDRDVAIALVAEVPVSSALPASAQSPSPLPVPAEPVAEATADGASSDQADADDAYVEEDEDAWPRDPLDWLASAAGFADGESWWNHMVEERGDGEGLFEAIAEAMTELRQHAPKRPHSEQQQEDIREAHMRMSLREAVKQGHQRIAVVCGAWHVPALATPGSAAADNRLLKGMPKLKTETTWVPWTYRHLSAGSGYGAGVVAPGWYEHLWRSESAPAQRAIGWYARIARLLRDQGIDCSSAHLIEAARLADTLAALRERAAPGLDEINESARCTICNGDDAPMQLIAEKLVIGEALGSVPASVPTVPLQRDLESEQKRLRLKAEVLEKNLDLDLRNDSDLQRSHLLHRLRLLDIVWGELARTGQSARGTFHEIWSLAWKPEFQIELIVASRYGQTVAAAASQRAIERSAELTSLPALAELVDRVLLANLPAAVRVVATALESRATTNSEPMALLDALPALANVYRYGNVRRTDTAQVADLFDSMLLRACIGLRLAVCDLDEEAAEGARSSLLAADRAIGLRQGAQQTEAWRRALGICARAESGNPLLRGVATRLLLDASALDTEEVQQQLQLNLSQGAEPLASAHWLDGFLNRNATVLLHGDAVWSLIDAWLSALPDLHFVKIAALVRRTFSGFEAADRRDLAARVKQSAGSAPTAPVPAAEWDSERALRALPMLAELLGISDDA
jgi:hypothetical protein